MVGPGTRGRPVEIDPSRLSRIAVELFAERGYDEVSAAEVAEVAGVSRRSLFRYFPAKADLVWHGFHDGLEVLSVALLDSGDRAPTAAVLAAFGTMVERTPTPALTRVRLRILAEHPDLMSFGVGRLDEMASICAAYLRNRGVDDLTARVQAAAITAGAFTGYLHWATATTDEKPFESVRRALTAVAELS
jgi:AcrR family transcriptional regulator